MLSATVPSRDRLPTLPTSILSKTSGCSLSDTTLFPSFFLLCRSFSFHGSGVIPTTPLSLLTDNSVLSSYDTAYPFHRLPLYSTSFVNFSFLVDYFPSSSSLFHSILASSVIRSSSGHSCQAFLFYSFRHRVNLCCAPKNPGNISHAPRGVCIQPCNFSTVAHSPSNTRLHQHGPGKAAVHAANSPIYVIDLTTRQ